MVCRWGAGLGCWERGCAMQQALTGVACQPADARGYGSIWDAYWDQLGPVVQRVPYMTAVGNHGEAPMVAHRWPAEGAAGQGSSGCRAQRSSGGGPHPRRAAVCAGGALLTLPRPLARMRPVPAERDWPASGDRFPGSAQVYDSGGECGVAYYRHTRMPTPAEDQPWCVGGWAAGGGRQGRWDRRVSDGLGRQLCSWAHGQARPRLTEPSCCHSFYSDAGTLLSTGPSPSSNTPLNTRLSQAARSAPGLKRR